MSEPFRRFSADKLKHLDGESFQNFCNQLLDFEISRRHLSATLKGPPRQYVNDGGIDILINVHLPPRIPKTEFAHALTEDAIGSTCVSCKTGPSPGVDLRSDARKKEGPWAILRSGGQFCALVSTKANPDDWYQTTERSCSHFFKQGWTAC